MKMYILPLFCFFTLLCNAQKVDWAKLNTLQSDRILLSGQRQPTKVLLLGTFHFAYPQADAHKTDQKNFIDVLSAQRQRELEELADVIKRFQPTRIYVESVKQAYHDSLYAAYLKNDYKPGANEIYQVGYRVAKQQNLSRVYTVDANPFTQENYKRFPWIDSMWKSSQLVDTVRDQYWNKMYATMYNAGDSVQTRLTMLENFLLMAEPSTLNRMHGHYLAGGFNSIDNNGPDLLSMWWYNRNLRIFNNILKTKPGSEDRIVVLFGNGHMPILKHCFQSSPEFEVVELKTLLQ
ncbi:MAG TPA: DUF5694 domain-containing protein [Flavisolibacter sp.]|nr:DUF5694 domain-containing protein [Flavisolibacter sp.]